MILLMSDLSRTVSAPESTSASPPPSSPAGSPLEEQLFPQISLRFLFALIAFAAAVLWTIRVAVAGSHLWAQCALVVMGTAAGCFLLYAVLFLLARAIAGPSGSAVPETLPHDGDTQRASATQQLREDR